jgi:hypothetical protein
MTVMIAVSSLSAYALAYGDCPEPSCCCWGAAMDVKGETGHTGNELRIKADKGCCCGDADAKTCSLTTLAPFGTIGWALSTHRFDPSFDILSCIAPMNDGGDESAIVCHPSTGFDVIHPGSPPIYLSAMSFLC